LIVTFGIGPAPSRSTITDEALPKQASSKRSVAVPEVCAAITRPVTVAPQVGVIATVAGRVWLVSVALMTATSAV
jgi:hypothetical protein